MFQSTLPHGERPVSLADMILKVDVSIHAPARGATVGVLDDFYKHVLEGKIENLQNLTLLFVTFL